MFFKPKVDLNILRMFRVYHNRSFEPLIPFHFITQTMDMRHGVIGSDLIEIQSQPYWNRGTM